MAPRILARSGPPAGWAHPYSSPFVCYADGGDDGAADAAGADMTTAPVEMDADDAPADDWTPPTREEWEKLQADKVSASAEARDRRKWLIAAGFSPRTGERLQPEEPAANEPAAPQDDQQAQAPSPAEMKRAVDKAVTEAQLTGRRQMRTFAVGFNKALTEAGWNGTRLDSLMKLIDLDDVDFDEGEIVGLSEQLDGLKSEWPEFFKRTRNSANAANGAGSSGQNGVTAAKVDAADKPAPKPEPKGWAEQVADKILRG